MATWNVDPAHSTLGFAVRHLGFSKVRGRFKSYQGSIELPEGADLAAATATASVDVESIDTDVADRDGHLRSADFFDAATWPKMSFRSTAVRPKGEGFEVQGELTIRDVTRPVTVTVEEIGNAKDPWGNDRIVLAARGKVNRKEFGLKWNMALEAGGFLVGDEVEITLEVQAVRAAGA